MMWADLELREIRAFLVLAEELHFGRSADRLGVTPSRVSQTIRHLEGRLGGRLFDRTSRRVRLTPAGEQLRQDAGRAYELLSQALVRVRAGASGVAGVLRIGTYSRCNGGPRFVEIVRAFEARYPDCRVQIVETGLDRAQLDWLGQGEIDLLLMRLPLKDSRVVIGPCLSCEPRVLAVSTEHPLAKLSSVSTEDLADCTVVDVPTLPRELLEEFIPPRTPSGKVIRRTPSRSVAEVSLRVALGEIVHPTVPAFLEHYPHDGMTSVPIRDLPPSRTALVWLKEQQGARHQVFAEAAADVLASRNGARTQPD